jgi:hypothetical protein
VTERIEVWGRRLMRPRVNTYRLATPYRFVGWGWNRYGGIPGTPYHGVTIGIEVMVRGRSFGLRWARPEVHTEEAR